MATINQDMAEKIAKNNGVYPGDPQCYAVFKYYNSNFDKWCWAIAYDKSDLERYNIYEIEFLWHRNPDPSLN